MIRLHFVVESQTEETFVNDVLSVHLAGFGVQADARCVQTSKSRGKIHRGGGSRYKHIRRDLELWLKQDRGSEVRFTSMFDLYGLPKDFPGRDEAAHRQDPHQRVKLLEQRFKEHLADRRFLLYIQLHEFEALLLTAPEELLSAFPNRTAEALRLQGECEGFKSPELIDDDPETAPSKRIIALIPEYRGMKVSAGPRVAAKIGLDRMRQACPHFGVPPQLEREGAFRR